MRLVVVFSWTHILLFAHTVHAQIDGVTAQFRFDGQTGSEAAVVGPGMEFTNFVSPGNANTAWDVDISSTAIDATATLLEAIPANIPWTPRLDVGLTAPFSFASASFDNVFPGPPVVSSDVSSYPGKVCPGVEPPTVTLGADLVVMFDDGGLAPGEFVRFRVDLTTVPEPSALGMLVSIVAGVSLRRRRIEF